MILLLLTVFCLSLFSMDIGVEESTSVYICTGYKSTTYHSNSKCRGLNRCNEEVKAIISTDAKKMGREGIVKFIMNQEKHYEK